MNEDPVSIETGSFIASGGPGSRSDRIPEAAEDLRGLAAEKDECDDRDDCDKSKDECVLGETLATLGHRLGEAHEGPVCTVGHNHLLWATVQSVGLSLSEPLHTSSHAARRYSFVPSGVHMTEYGRHGLKVPCGRAARCHRTPSEAISATRPLSRGSGGRP